MTVLFHSPILVSSIQLYHPIDAFHCPEMQSTKGTGTSSGAGSGTGGGGGGGIGGGGDNNGGGQGGSSAPRVFQVYGWTTDPSSSSINPPATHGNQGSGQHQGQGPEGVQGSRELKLPTLLGTFEFLNPCTMTQPQQVKNTPSRSMYNDIVAHTHTHTLSHTHTHTHDLYLRYINTPSVNLFCRHTNIPSQSIVSVH